MLNLAADIALVGHGNHEIRALDKDSARAYGLIEPQRVRDRRDAVALQVVDGDFDLREADVVGEEDRRRTQVRDTHHVTVHDGELSAEAGKGQERLSEWNNDLSLA